MKLNKMAWLTAAAIGLSSGIANAQQFGNYGGVQQVSCEAPACGCSEPACGCEVACEPECGLEAACDPCCDVAGGCDSGCDSMCGGGLGLGLGLGSLLGGMGDCNLGEQWSLFGSHNGISVGGWTQFGYHSQDAGPFRFNQHADRVNLHQAWIYAEKALDTSCGWDIGGRVDYLYGVDAQDTQAFNTEPLLGIGNDHWDTSWDNGIYGRAMPQLYGEIGYGDISVKVGHFFTLIGYEVVAATGNFFYSHAYTMYNSEPFTHTGALATWNASDDVTLYGGYVLGWDSGFEDNGDAFLGGMTLQLTDDVSMTYGTVMGRFQDLNQVGFSERGYMHSLIFNVALTDKLTYIFQNDYLDTEDAGGNLVRDTFGINQYLLYNISDCWAVGTRAEWYNVNFGGGDNADIYAWTFGLNYRPHANVIVRPELRWDWDKDDVPVGINENGRDSQATFGMDTIFLF